MLPVAVIEALEAGLLYFRRFMSVYNKANKAIDVAKDINELFNDDLRHHRSVEGEEVYLFLLGRETVKPSLIGYGLSKSEVDSAIYLALIASLRHRGSNDLRNTLLSYAYHLGQVLQSLDESFASRASLFLSDQVFVSHDPVFDLLQSMSNSIPDDVKKFLSTMEIDKTLLPSITASLKQGGFVKDWISAIENPTRVRIHRSQTFLGHIIRGANTVMDDGPDYYSVTSGPDGLAISLSGLAAPSIVMYNRARLRHVRTITRDMISITAKREMYRRGYVEVDGGGWALRSDVVLEPKTADPSSPKVFRLVSAPVNIDVIDNAVSTVSGKLETMVKTDVLDALMAKGRRISAANQINKSRLDKTD